MPLSYSYKQLPLATNLKIGIAMSLHDTYDDSVILPFLRNTLFKAPAGKSLTHGEIITQQPAMPGVYFDAPDIELNYDIFIVANSGGKDGMAALKRLLDLGVPTSQIEIWHHLVDGNEGEASFMDWAFMDDYIVKVGQALNIPVYFSWLKLGFKGEMLKQNTHSQPIHIETPSGLVVADRRTTRIIRDENSPLNGQRVPVEDTRMQFPQQAASLQTRWCSSALKIDVSRRAITMQERFVGKRVLFVTGERREESSNRARYNQLEPHSTDIDRKARKSGVSATPRHVDAWRPVLHYSEEMVWQALSDWRLVPAVPYRLGWSRSSCQTCIFNGDAIWATIGAYWPERLAEINAFEQQFGSTISRKRLTVADRAAAATPLAITDTEALAQSMQKEYTLPIFLRDGEGWALPAGAFSDIASGAN
jgi:3'-phosphoadenosine 5'-phosphosulfate sulfotransferase (PAPS reductase)/FAD synthetase